MKQNGFYEFGPYRLDAVQRVLYREEQPVLITPKALEVLLVLVKSSGEVVSKDQLMSEVWPDTFVEPNNLAFNISLLRKALGENGDERAYIETVPKRGYRFIGVLHDTGLAEKTRLSSPITQAPAPALAKSSLWPKLWIGAACMLCLAVGWLLHLRSARPTAPVSVVRLTTDAGLDDKPALSKDGKLLAFSSDRSPDGGRNIYLKHVAGGDTLQLTFDGLGNTAPDFSPDGTQIVFHSDRDGGGLYVMPTLGGAPRFLAHGGLDPKFSPDGSRIAYWVGDPFVAQTVPGGGTVYTISLADAVPKPLATQHTNSRYPIWLPDSQHLLFISYTSHKAYDNNALDWWIQPIDGGQAERTGIYEAFVQAGLRKSDPALDLSTFAGAPAGPTPSCWDADNNVIFSAALGDSQNLWEVAMSAHRVTRPFRRLTTGAGYEVWPACSANGDLAFINFEMHRDVWLQETDLNKGKTAAVLARVTAGPAVREYSALSIDGSHVAFSSSQLGRLNVWIRDLKTSHEVQVVGGSRLGATLPGPGSFQQPSRLFGIPTRR